jgi:hypothetical protein
MKKALAWAVPLGVAAVVLLLLFVFSTGSPSEPFKYDAF